MGAYGGLYRGDAYKVDFKYFFVAHSLSVGNTMQSVCFQHNQSIHYTAYKVPEQSVFVCLHISLSASCFIAELCVVMFYAYIWSTCQKRKEG